MPKRKTVTTDKKSIQNLNALIAKIMAGMKPPEDLTVTQWAEKNRRLSLECSSEPGLWRTSRTPYLQGPMDAFTDPKVRRISMAAASQVGKSEFEMNIIGYIIAQDPGSILFIHPTNVDARDFSKMRIVPMIRDCPSLRKKVAAPKSRDSGNTVLQKMYPGGILTMCGSTEAHSLCSKPIRYIIGDERDRWAASAGKEGDPWLLAMARQKTFYNAKAVEVSTPTVKNASAIEKSFHEGTMERWKVKCPHCGEYHDIEWENIRYDSKEDIVKGVKTYSVSNIHYICPGCACISDEFTIKHQPAKWIADNPDAYEKGVRSFWLNAFVSPWAEWEKIILEYLNAAGSTKRLQVIYNTSFGKLWENRDGLEDEEGMLERREEYPAELPEGVLVLTAGVDTQNDRMEYEVVGHGHFGETWGIEKGIVMGRPDDPKTWAMLDEAVFDRTFHFQDGIRLRLSMSFVDEGGLFTQEVRLRCQERMGKKVFCIKGMSGQDTPYTAPPKKMKITIQNRIAGYCWQYQLGVDSGKQIIMDNLKAKAPGPRYCHFPKRDDYGFGYFQGLLSERLEYDPEKKHPWGWVKIPGHERNEALDCRNYALAAFKILPVNLDAIDRKLKILRGKAVPEAKAAPVQAPQVRQPSQRQWALEKYFDEW